MAFILKCVDICDNSTLNLFPFVGAFSSINKGNISLIIIKSGKPLLNLFSIFWINVFGGSCFFICKKNCFSDILLLTYIRLCGIYNYHFNKYKDNRMFTQLENFKDLNVYDDQRWFYKGIYILETIREEQDETIQLVRKGKENYESISN